MKDGVKEGGPALILLAVLAVLPTSTGIVVVLGISEWTMHPHNGGFGNLWLIFPLLFAILVCPLPAVATAIVALVASSRVQHQDAVVAFAVLTLLSVGVVAVLAVGPNNGLTTWILQRMSRDPGDLLRAPRPVLELSALDLLIPVAAFAYTVAGARIRPAIMIACVVLAATGTGLLFLIGAG